MNDTLNEYICDIYLKYDNYLWDVSQLLWKYFGINWNVCKSILPINGNKDGDLEKSPKMSKVIIVLFSNRQFNVKYFKSFFTF